MAAPAGAVPVWADSCPGGGADRGWTWDAGDLGLSAAELASAPNAPRLAKRRRPGDLLPAGSQEVPRAAPTVDAAKASRLLRTVRQRLAEQGSAVLEAVWDAGLLRTGRRTNLHGLLRDDAVWPPADLVGVCMHATLRLYPNARKLQADLLRVLVGGLLWFRSEMDSGLRVGLRNVIASLPADVAAAGFDVADFVRRAAGADGPLQPQQQQPGECLHSPGPDCPPRARVYCQAADDIIRQITPGEVATAARNDCELPELSVQTVRQRAGAGVYESDGDFEMDLRLALEGMALRSSTREEYVEAARLLKLLPTRMEAVGLIPISQPLVARAAWPGIGGGAPEDLHRAIEFLDSWAYRCRAVLGDALDSPAATHAEHGLTMDHATLRLKVRYNLHCSVLAFADDLNRVLWGHLRRLESDSDTRALKVHRLLRELRVALQKQWPQDFWG
eukprot:TRINITY_DN1676_c1_g1_i1.p1 TRINITY_DN1676_c1_g1~~TRINITY_DN1676_c1_g1_i1.p1  ORF type:complete len:472 (+),score=129.16 TRINITY_DN1676_c1_g1_i1:79-1416(+)